MKLYAIVFTFLILPFIVAANAYAATTCTPIYGGGQTCIQTGEILINKKVQFPERDANGNLLPANRFHDSIGLNDPRFRPGETVTFQLTVTNTGAATIASVTVKDLLPQEVNLNVQGPGVYDPNTRTLTFFMQNLNPGESRTEKLTAQVVSTNQLSADIVCPFNQVTAETNNGQVSQDNAQLCIEKQVVLGATPAPGKGGVAVPPTTTKGGLKVFPPPAAVTTPPTGPEALALAALIPTGFLGQFLRKRSIAR